MKSLKLAALGVLSSAGAALAGSVTYVAPAAVDVVQPAAPMGGSGAWLIPLIIVAVLALALSKKTPVVRGG